MRVTLANPPQIRWSIVIKRGVHDEFLELMNSSGALRCAGMYADDRNIVGFVLEPIGHRMLSYYVLATRAPIIRSMFLLGIVEWHGCMDQHR